MTTTTAAPKLYVGTYAKYNNGNISGQWVTLTDFTSYEKFLEHCAEIHSDETDPEFMYQDCENVPDSLYSESGAREIFELLAYCNEQDANFEAVCAFMDAFSISDVTDMPTYFDDACRGQYDSERDFSDELFDELYLHEVPQSVRYYIDYDAFCRDLFINDYTYHNGYVFSNQWQPPSPIHPQPATVIGAGIGSKNQNYYGKGNKQRSVKETSQRNYRLCYGAYWELF